MRLILNFFDNIYNRKRYLTIFIFSLSVICSLIFLSFFSKMGPSQHQLPGSDYLEYYQPVANSILQGKGIPVKEGLGIRYPPGYPIILSIIFGLSKLIEINELQLIVIFNIIITAATACFLFLIAKSIFNKKIAIIASILWLSYPFNLWFIKNPNTEIPFMLLLYAGIWLYISALKKRRFGFILFSGIILGFASLIRPVSLLFPFLLALLTIFLLKENPKRIYFLLALVLLIGSFMAIFPWEAYVFSATKQLIPLSKGGSPAVIDGLTFALTTGAEGDKVTVPGDVLALMERARNADLDTGTKILQFCTRELMEKPTTFLKLLGLKLTRSWYATSQMWWEGKILMVQLLYLLTGLTGLIYVIKVNKNKIRWIIFLLSIVLYFWAMTVSVHSVLRYMVPAMGLVIIFSAITVSVILDKLLKKFKFLNYDVQNFNNHSLSE